MTCRMPQCVPAARVWVAFAGRITPWSLQVVGTLMASDENGSGMGGASVTAVGEIVPPALWTAWAAPA